MQNSNLKKQNNLFPDFPICVFQIVPDLPEDRQSVIEVPLY